MSALGQKQTFAVHQPMSALPPIADIPGDDQHVRFVPKAELMQCSNWDRYSITSLASAKKFIGSSMPVAFAVLRLMTSL